MYSPQDAITGSSGCLAIDLMLPEHLPKKQPNNFPVMKYIHYYRNIEKQLKSFKEINARMTLAISRNQCKNDISNIKKSISTFALRQHN
jgi:hypothetical protein